MVEPGDGKLTLKDSDGDTLGVFTANQIGDTEIVIPAGFSGDYNDLTNKPDVGDGTLQINDSNGDPVATFTANQQGDTSFNLPEGFSGDYNDLINKPDIGDGTLTINDSDGNSLGTFTANQQGNTTLNLPAQGAVNWDDIEGKPCIPECCEFEIPIREVYQGDEGGNKVVDINNEDFPDSLVVGSVIGMPKNTNGPWYDATVTSITDMGGHKSLEIDPWETYLDCFGCGGAFIKFNACGDGDPVDWNDIINKPDIGDGPLVIKDANNTTLGTFTANQQGSTDITLPAGFSGDYDDLANKPTIGDGNIVINGGDGITASGDNATANQAGDTARTLSVDTTWLGTWIDTNKPAPNVGDGQITIKDADGNPVGQFSVNQASDQDIILPAIPDSLHPKGFINVDDPAPANPEVGDIYIQHKDDVSDGISDASFAPGIPTGTAVEEGTFVMYGADLQWHAGGNSNSTQVQSDWNETNTTEPSFIQNKPDIDGLINAAVNDGKLTLTNKHNTTKVLDFTANQAADLEVQMPYIPLDIRELQELTL